MASPMGSHGVTPHAALTTGIPRWFTCP